MEHDSVAAPGGLEVLGFDVRVRNEITESSLGMAILYVCTYVCSGSCTHTCPDAVIHVLVYNYVQER